MKLIMENWRGYLKEQEEALQTLGDLKKAVNGAVLAKRKGQGKSAVKDVATGALLGLIPGGGVAKNIFDVAKAIYKLPDDKATNTGLDFLNVDDEVSAIVSDKVENAFLKALSSELKNYPDDTPLKHANVTTMLSKFISREFNQRTVVTPEEEQ